MKADADVTATSSVALSGLVFPEAPRWHDNKLWFVDMYGHQLLRWDVEYPTHPEIVASFPNDVPAGIGFMPDGSTLVAQRWTKQVMRVLPDRVELFADLSPVNVGTINDLVMAADGRAFVGGTWGADPSGSDCIIALDPDGAYRVVTEDIRSPNGMAITPDGATLIVAETEMHDIVTFSISESLSLEGKAVFGEYGDARPDGLCLDEHGAVWFGAVETGMFARSLPGGRIVEQISLPNGRLAVACGLGGADGRTLFMMTADTTIRNIRQNHARGSKGYVETMKVDVAGVGSP